MRGLIVLGTMFAAVLAGEGLMVIREVKQKHVGIWLGAYLGRRRNRAGAFNQARSEGPIHILFCMVDHFEPISSGSTREQERERMRDWLERYPALAARHEESHGRPPEHTVVYPGD